ncbi:MAG: DNA ligase D [Chloroflexi bacterium]|nr:DNA ligase D [Chloroflexota bacterium]
MLRDYERKRDLGRSPEPAGGQPGSGALLFAVQKHAARRLHYDLRLEVDGVLKSWAVPAGPSLDPGAKRLAVMVEDHPLDYASFEGVIPEGQYGAGGVIVWDRGDYSPEADGALFFDDRAGAEAQARRGLERGKLSFYLRGGKLKGSWALVRMRQAGDNWLLIKHADAYADPAKDILQEARSVISGLTVEEIKAGKRPGPPRPQEIPGARPAPFPEAVAPMLASLAEAPFTDPAWLFEPKLDGYRTLAFVRQGRVTLKSRRGLDVTAEYPYLLPGLEKQPVETAAFDGEIVALDDKGRPSFQGLQQHLKLIREKSRSEAGAHVLYYVFDILYLDGYDLRGAALSERQAVLRRALAPDNRVRLIDSFEGDGAAVYRAAVANGLEGIIAKRKDSVYEPGRRSRSWLKIKAVQTGEFIIAGYTQGGGARAGAFGSLLLGYYDGDRLVYSGNVGTGFDEATLADLKARMDRLRTERPAFEIPPMPPVTWLRPELVAEVKFAEWTQEGYLRAPVFLRLREDKAPAEVRRNEAPIAGESTSPPGDRQGLLEQLQRPGDSFGVEVDGSRFGLTNLDKALWPAAAGSRALTKRDLLLYLARVSALLLPHLRDRPLTLTRYPHGIHGEHFYQKHYSDPLPDFVERVSLSSEHAGGFQDYIMCNNLPTLLWLGQLADLELHTWFSRVSAAPEGFALDSFGPSPKEAADRLLDYPDFIVFDMDPYIYSGREKGGAEPELNRRAFLKVCEIALRLKEVLDSLSLAGFIKTSGKTGLHIFVPVRREYDYAAVRSAAGAVSGYLLRRYPADITTEWSVDKRAGKIFLDFNQNVRGKTLAAAYSPRPTPEATVSMPLRWEELGKAYPTDFTILTAPARLARTGDLWAGILDAKHDLKRILQG